MKKLSIMLLMSLVTLPSNQSISKYEKKQKSLNNTSDIATITNDAIYDPILNLQLSSIAYKNTYIQTLGKKEFEVYDGAWNLGKVVITPRLYEINKNFVALNGYSTYVLFYRLSVIPCQTTYYTWGKQYRSMTDNVSVNLKIFDSALDSGKDWENIIVHNVQPATTVVNSNYSDTFQWSFGTEASKEQGLEASSEGLSANGTIGHSINFGISYSYSYSSEISGVTYENNSMLTYDSNQTINSTFKFNAATPIARSSHMLNNVNLIGSTCFSVKDFKNYSTKYRVAFEADAGFKTVQKNYFNKNSSYFDKETTYYYNQNNNNNSFKTSFIFTY